MELLDDFELGGNGSCIILQAEGMMSRAKFVGLNHECCEMFGFSGREFEHHFARDTPIDIPAPDEGGVVGTAAGPTVRSTRRAISKVQRLQRVSILARGASWRL
jgi:hypothetical protein